MEQWITANWLYFAIAALCYVVGRIHGRSSAEAHLMYMTQQQAQQDMFNAYINGLKKAGE